MDSVVLSTDNRLMHRTHLAREYEIAAEAFGLTLGDLRRLVLTSFDRSFMPVGYAEKMEYVRGVMAYFDAAVEGLLV